MLDGIAQTVWKWLQPAFEEIKDWVGGPILIFLAMLFYFLWKDSLYPFIMERYNVIKDKRDTKIQIEKILFVIQNDLKKILQTFIISLKKRPGYYEYLLKKFKKDLNELLMKQSEELGFSQVEAEIVQEKIIVQLQENCKKYLATIDRQDQLLKWLEEKLQGTGLEGLIKWWNNYRKEKESAANLVRFQINKFHGKPEEKSYVNLLNWWKKNRQAKAKAKTIKQLATLLEDTLEPEIQKYFKAIDYSLAKHKTYWPKFSKNIKKLVQEKAEPLGFIQTEIDEFCKSLLQELDNVIQGFKSPADVKKFAHEEMEKLADEKFIKNIEKRKNPGNNQFDYRNGMYGLEDW